MNIGRATPASGSAAPQTPAGRLIELRRELAYLQRELDEAKAKASRAEERLQRFTTIGGVSFGGISIAQSWAEFVLWESILNERRFNAVVELGTWEGGFSEWLGAQCRIRNIHFETYDAIPPNRRPLHFVRRDIFAEKETLIRELRLWEPVVLFCDNGNKPRELREIATALQDPASLAVVHDWGTEVQPEDVPDSLEMVYERFCEDLGSMSRVFRRRDA